MQRSFTDRVFGGVCGGLAASLRINSWFIRALFIVAAVASLGAFAALYVLLWWIVPQEHLTAPERHGVSLFVVLLLLAATAALWALRDQGLLNAPDGTSLYLPLLALMLSLVFFLRQVRA